MIITLCGHPGAGKSESARFLCSEYSLSRRSFADPLKDAVASLFGFDRELLSGSFDREWRERVDPRWGITPRQALERTGEAMRREYGPNFFVQCWDAKGPQNTVTDDMRHTSEIRRASQLGALMIWIRRDNVRPSWEEFAINEPASMPHDFPHVHVSRWEWLQHTRGMIVVDNNGTVPQLHDNLRAAIGEKGRA